jgi:flagellar basal body L-ring protein FlgH
VNQVLKIENERSAGAGLSCPSPVARHSSLTILALCALISGCVMAPPEPDYTATNPEPTPPASQSNGSSYQAGHDIALFENSVARRVGDTLIVR